MAIDLKEKEDGETNLGYIGDESKDSDKVHSAKKDSSNKIENLDDKSMKFAIYKNVIIISFAFVFLFTSFNSMANLQSSINKTLGTTSLWFLYASLVLSCSFLPSIIIKRLKTKWTLPFSMLCYSSYIAAQFYPRYWTLLPTAVLLGMGAAPMWSAKCSYLTQVGVIYGNIVGETSEVIITRFFGIFFLFFQSSHVWGNLISSTVLSAGVDDVSRTDEFLDYCGANYCPSFGDNLTVTAPNITVEEAEEEKEKQRQKVIFMSCIFLVCSLLSAVIVAIFVDPLSKFGIDEEKSNDKSTKELFVASFTHMKNIYQILIIPLTMWSGLEQAFLGADFTAAFVSCGLGIHMVGYVMIAYGVCDALFSFCFTPVVKKVGRVATFSFGALLNVILLVVMSFWKPNPAEKSVFFIIAALWGTSDAIWQTQINAFYGVIFPGQAEAAFSNYRLWESLGFIIAYVFSGIICIEAKIVMLFVFLALGMAGYYLIEIIEKRGGLTNKGTKVVTVSDFFQLKQANKVEE